mmetsp:Transcript_38107/g.95446  ORF Transcript_38107/g.95446 Transcript_38107/m.95446 type:complete len:220 (-) Transcript_38107:40-699(-)
MVLKHLVESGPARRCGPVHAAVAATGTLQQPISWNGAADGAVALDDVGMGEFVKEVPLAVERDRVELQIGRHCVHRLVPIALRSPDRLTFKLVAEWRPVQHLLRVVVGLLIVMFLSLLVESEVLVQTLQRHLPGDLAGVPRAAVDVAVRTGADCMADREVVGAPRPALPPVGQLLTRRREGMVSLLLSLDTENPIESTQRIVALWADDVVDVCAIGRQG